jgi:3-deoxy-D-manno-octulosonic-acid transferase
MFFFYNLLLTAAIPFIACYLGFQALFRRKIRRGMRERLGFPKIRPAEPNQSTFWLHAVSVGEVHAAAPFARALKDKLPGWRFVLSTVTETGRDAGARRIPEADARIYFPLDLLWSVSAAIKRVRPNLVIILETEIWPNFFNRLRIQGIPVFIVNGRISPGSFRRYVWLRLFMARVLRSVAGFGMQTETDARRITELGAPPERVRTTGNLKFDGAASAEAVTLEEKKAVRQELGFAEEAPVWVAGSVHPDEESPVIDAYLSLLKAHPDLRLVLTPRHVERASAISSLLRQRGIVFRLREGNGNGEPRDAPVLVLNTMGELGRTYRAADVAFVGGSLIPWGGQNPLEPAGLGVPVLFGEHMHNFEEPARALTEPGATGEVAARRIEGPLNGSSARLAEAVGHLLASPDLAERMGERGREVVRAQAGVADKYAEWVTEIVAGRT